MEQILKKAVEAARAAGRIILLYFSQLDRIDVTTKGHNDFVTKADKEAEEAIIETVLKAFPGHSVLAEERGKIEGQEYTWVIDPLDGTTNFIHGFPHFAVSISVSRNSVIEHGVVFDPLRNEMFTASRGRGAELNGRRIFVNNIKRFDRSLLGTGFPLKDLNKIRPWMNIFSALLPQAAGIRRAGSAALDLAYVAMGRFAGFWELCLKPWDIYAGALLVREAGGLVGNLENGDENLSSGNILAGNKIIFTELLNIILDMQINTQNDNMV